MVALKLPKCDPIHKVSIIPRGGALGVTVTLPKEDILNYSKERINNQIAMLLGGRIAEEIIFKEMTTGASNDIERATELARNMVCQWGMSTLGPINFSKGQAQPFYGMSGADNSTYSENTALKIDGEIKTIIETNYGVAQKILTENVEILHKMAQALIDWETLDNEQVLKIMAGEDIGIPVLEIHTEIKEEATSTNA